MISFHFKCLVVHRGGTLIKTVFEFLTFFFYDYDWVFLLLFFLDGRTIHYSMYTAAADRQEWRHG